MLAVPHKNFDFLPLHEASRRLHIVRQCFKNQLTNMRETSSAKILDSNETQIHFVEVPNTKSGYYHVIPRSISVTASSMQSTQMQHVGELPEGCSRVDHVEHSGQPQLNRCRPAVNCGFLLSYF